MRHRLSKIYTRTGDKGTTGLGDGTRTPKDSTRVEAFGTVDELNSAIGLLLAENDLPGAVRAVLTNIQHELFDLGGELCLPGYAGIRPDQVNRLEEILDELNTDLPPLKEFILPGGNRPAALCHMARSVCRRAERRVVTLLRTETVQPPALTYLNRLSDLLFVIARVLARQAGGEEVLWRHER
jgi:cob(I)alamin adenosyltransferase